MVFYSVTIQSKSPAHPLYGQGSKAGFVLNDLEGASISLYPQESLSFSFNYPYLEHPLVITDDPRGGWGVLPSQLTANWLSPLNQTSSQEISYQQLLSLAKESVDGYPYCYYQCSLHPQMGGLIVLLPSPSK